MEAAILLVERKRTYELPNLSQNEWNIAAEAARKLADSLRQLLALQQQYTNTSASKKKEEISVKWLLNVCSTISSQLGPYHLVRAIWSAAQLHDEAQQQGALFDALGESGHGRYVSSGTTHGRY